VGTKGKPIPDQYEANEHAILTTQQANRSEDDTDNSDNTYDNGETLDYEGNKYVMEILWMISNASQYGWNECNIMNTVTICMHLAYKERFIGTIGSKQANYIISDSGADTYIIGRHG